MEVARILILLAAPAVVLCELVDLSYVYDKSTLAWITERPFQMAVTYNGSTALLPWVQTEEIVTGTHVGTHIDAPCRKVRGRWTLEDIPLSRLVAPAAVVDITFRANADPNALLLISDLENWEKLSGCSLNGTIVLVRTGWGCRWPDRVAYTGNAYGDVTRLRFPGVSEEAARWLTCKRSIYGVGIDTLTLDSGANVVKGEPAHQALLGANVFGLENVANLHKLPNFGVKLYVLPMRLGGGACGSPARIVAQIP